MLVERKGRLKKNETMNFSNFGFLSFIKFALPMAFLISTPRRALLALTRNKCVKTLCRYDCAGANFSGFDVTLPDQLIELGPTDPDCVTRLGDRERELGCFVLVHVRPFCP